MSALLTANPAAYPALAAQYPGQYTLAAQQATTADQVPSALATGFASAAPRMKQGNRAGPLPLCSYRVRA